MQHTQACNHTHTQTHTHSLAPPTDPSSSSTDTVFTTGFPQLICDAVHTNILAAGLFMWSLSVAGYLPWHIFLHDQCLHLLIYLFSLSLSILLCVYPVLFTVFLPSAKD